MQPPWTSVVKWQKKGKTVKGMKMVFCLSLPVPPLNEEERKLRHQFVANILAARGLTRDMIEQVQNCYETDDSEDDDEDSDAESVFSELGWNPPRPAYRPDASVYQRFCDKYSMWTADDISCVFPSLLPKTTPVLVDGEYEDPGGSFFVGWRECFPARLGIDTADSNN